MKLPFEDFDEENSSQKLSIVEKTVIEVAVLFIKAVLWKIRRVKTYGDILKLGSFLDDLGGNIGSSINESSSNTEKFTSLMSEIKEMSKEVKKL